MNIEKIRKVASKYLGNKYVLTFAVFALWLMFFDKASVVSWLEDLNEGRNMKKQKAYYAKEIKLVDENLNDLNTNNESLEKFAREQFYFQNDDEDVYIIEEEDLED